MKQTIQFLTTCILCLSVQFSFGQTTNTPEKKKKTYIVWVKPIDNTSTIKGYLSEVGDMLVVTPIKKNQTDHRIKLDQVNYLKFRKKGKIGKGLLIGGISGLGIGALVGLATHKSSSSSDSFSINLGPEFSVLGGGIVGAISGLIIGRIVGGKKITIPIQGSKKSIQAQKEELLKYKFGG